MAQADATIANAATPSIRVGLGASGAALELVIGGYQIAFAVLLIASLSVPGRPVVAVGLFEGGGLVTGQF
jgi:hypothetical protein